MGLGPVELVHLVARGGDEALELVEKHNEVIARLLGHSPVKDPVRAVQVYRGIVRRLRRDYKEQCYRVGEWKYCLYQYKEIGASGYLRVPVLSAMRGYVAGYRYEGGEIVEARTLAFPFAKFFNLGETEYTQKLPGAPGLITEKLDGTLIIVWRGPDGELHFNTRGLLQWFGVVAGKNGVYTVRGGEYANLYVAAFVSAVERMGLRRDLEDLVGDGETVMFELVHPAAAASRIALYRRFDAVPAPSDPGWTPYVLAKRVNREPWTLTYVRGTAFPEPETIEYGDVYELVEVVRNWRDKEGVVAYYPERVYRPELGFKWWNYLVKIKSPRYVMAALIYGSGHVSWRSVARNTLTGFLDDIVALGDAEVSEFARRVWAKYEEILAEWTALAEELRGRYGRELPENIRNYITKSLNMRWIYGPLAEAVRKERYEGTLKRLIIKALPKNKDAILSYLDRLGRKISWLRVQLRQAQ